MTYQLKILPRWLIFMLDIICVQLSIFLSFVIRFNFDLNQVSHQANHNFKLIFAVTLLVNTVLFYAAKSYAGIVRYTNIEDTFRLLRVSAIATIAYFIISSLTSYAQVPALFPMSVIVVNFFISNFALISYRLGVRYCFRYYSQYLVDNRETKAAVYDTSADGLHTKQVINDVPNGTIEVVAFLDDNRSGKIMEGLPIYGTNEADFKQLQEDKVKLLIIANHNIPKEKLNYLVDTCPKYGIHLQQVPPIQQWLDGKLDTAQLKDINIEDLLEREVIQINNGKVSTELRGKTILVTGAAGSIGSELVRQLVNLSPSLVIMCDIAESPMHALWLEMHEKNKHANIKPYLGDICDRVRMEHLFEIYNPDFVFHAAAYKHVPLMEDNPSIAVLNNVLGTKILAELAVNNGVEKFVMVSTDKAVNPTNIMGASKRIAEIFTQSFYKHNMLGYDELDTSTGVTMHPTKFVTTRFGNVLGSNGSVIPHFKQQLEKGGPITVTHPEITRYFMTIPEACQLIIEAGVMGQGGEIFVFDMGKPVKIVDLAKKMIRLAGKEPDQDIAIVFTGLRPGEKLYEELLNNAENTKPTYHEKIMIAEVREYDFLTVHNKIEKLIASARYHYTLETVGMMKDLVPEYISQNSVFEKLDVKPKDKK
jgi:FlaA1/EpsC-like NDP-sugar epimerase